MRKNGTNTALTEGVIRIQLQNHFDTNDHFVLNQKVFCGVVGTVAHRLRKNLVKKNLDGFFDDLIFVEIAPNQKVVVLWTIIGRLLTKMVPLER